MAPPEAGAAGRLRMLLATGLGAGYAPIAPGTAGSILGVALAWLLLPAGRVALLAAFVVVTALGFWSAGAAARRLGREDPGPVVIDEIAGQLLALCAAPREPLWFLAGFVLFRVLDVVKPPPLRRLEALPGASGIMADDLMAGVYVVLATALALRVLPL